MRLLWEDRAWEDYLGWQQDKKALKLYHARDIMTETRNGAFCAVLFVSKYCCQVSSWGYDFETVIEIKGVSVLATCRDSKGSPINGHSPQLEKAMKGVTNGYGLVFKECVGNFV